MWEDLAKIKAEARHTSYFLDWMDHEVIDPGFLKQADDLLKQAENKVPALKLYRTTPQTAPWHVEGPMVADGIIRMLAGVFAIVEGADLRQVEELARHKALAFEINELSEIIKENAATLQAYCLVHDIAKPATLSFEAPMGSLGETEGFSQHKYRVSAQATEAEVIIYHKLIKAFHTEHPDLNNQELTAKFYDKYEIRTHYFDHDKRGASREYLDAREAISDMLRLEVRDRALLTFLIRNHIDVFTFFSRGANPKKYQLMTARAVKADFDPDDALDLMLAAAFLDSSLGAVNYRDQKFSVDLNSTIHMLISEEETSTYRKDKRRERAAQKHKQVLKDSLLRANLSPEEVFLLLEVSFGPERGRVMDKIYSLIEDGGTIDFGSKTSQMAPKIKKAREFFDHAKISR